MASDWPIIALKKPCATTSTSWPLAASGQDVLVVAHGFFNAMIGQALARLGWRCVQDGGFRYWSARRFESQQR